MKPVLLLNKNKGETPLECLERFRGKNEDYKDVPMTYAGRLDPMAEGLLLVLAGEECKKKDEYLNLPKTYEFEILWDFETDTLDLLGLVTKNENKFPTILEVEKVIKKYIGKQKQIYPTYSSKTVNGKPLFDHARSGTLDEIEMPEREIEIFSLNFLGNRKTTGSDLQKYIKESVALVRGDFRQKEIEKRWDGVIDKEKIYQTSSFKVECSSGTYVRVLTKNIANKLGVFGTTFSIKRTNVGNYSLLRDRVSK